LGQLANLLNKEFARSRSAGRAQIENAVHKQRADKREQTSPLRKSSLKTSAAQAQAEARAIQNQQDDSELVVSLKRQLKESHNEFERLRNEMSAMVR
jgi:hypothetical protein